MNHVVIKKRLLACKKGNVLDFTPRNFKMKQYLRRMVSQYIEDITPTYTL
jgi:hypothetical protein